MYRIVLRLTVTLIVTAIFTACSDTAIDVALQDRSAPQSELPVPAATVPPHLPGPAELLKSPQAFPASTGDTAYGRTRSGAGFDEALPRNRVAPQGTEVEFFPGDPNLPAGLADVAYCTYRFQVAPFLRQDALKLDWSDHPAPQGEYWVGISNFAANRWQWLGGPADGVEITQVALDALSDPETGTLFVVIAVASPVAHRLDRIEITGPGTAHTWVPPGWSPGLYLASESTLDGDGNLYLVAFYKYVGSVPNDNKYYIAKFSQSGELLWQREYTLADDSSLWATGVVVDSANALIVAGVSFTYTDTGFTPLVIKINSDGTLAWERRYLIEHAGTNISLNSYGMGVVDGEIYLTHYGSIGGAGYVRLLACLAADGSPKWVKEFTFAPGETGALLGLSFTADSLLITGSVNAEQGVADQRFIAIKMDRDGTSIWQKHYSTDPYHASGWEIVCTENGKIYLGGTDYRLVLLELDETGQAIASRFWTQETFTSSIGLWSAGGSVYAQCYGRVGETTYSFIVQANEALEPVTVRAWRGLSANSAGQSLCIDANGALRLIALDDSLGRGQWYEDQPEFDEITAVTADLQGSFVQRDFAIQPLNSSFGDADGLVDADPEGLILLNCQPGESESVLPLPLG